MAARGKAWASQGWARRDFCWLARGLSSGKLGLGGPGLGWTTDGLGSGKLGPGRPRGARTQEPSDTGLLANRDVSTNGSRLAQSQLLRHCRKYALSTHGSPEGYHFGIQEILDIQALLESTGTVSC